MTLLRFRRIVCVSLLVVPQMLLPLRAQGQGERKASADPSRTADADADHVKQRAEWFLRGRMIPGKSSAELRRRAYEAKMQARASRLGPRSIVSRSRSAMPPTSSSGWMPLGPLPLASDASGDGFQDYRQVSGRATAVAIDPADATGNTVFIGGALGGVWKSTNAAASIANDVNWTAVTDDQAMLSVGSIAIQPGNSNPANSVVLVGTGEADNAADSYFGLGILRSADGGNTWTSIPTANGGSLSFSGLGGTRMAFSTSNTNTVVAAMAAAAEGIVDGALTANTERGLYTSTDAGQSWTYNAIFSGGASEATSATSVVYNAAAELFFAALRYHGFYSSPDGLNWTRLANQPGFSGLLSTTACSSNYVTTCPIYRGEITAMPGRNEMYVWFISLDSNQNPVDQGIWQSFDAGVTWTQISDNGIINCGDASGCGVDQGFYDLDLQAVPNCPSGAQSCPGNPTDLYAGAVNLYKCSISSLNPYCTNTPFLNLTHVYGCTVLGEPAHVHPDEHAMAYVISPGATDLMYFANDGGIYRALDGFTGLLTGSCSGTNLFDDLNQNLGSMTQFVSFSQDESDVNTILGGTQDNGSPATATATTGTSWGSVLSGDGGYNAIDSITGNWFASNPDTGLGSLNILECGSGTACTDSLFSEVVSSASVGGDDGAFYFPYILDPQSTSQMLVGTCRVWSGARTGGAFIDLSLNFDTFGIGTCSGQEVNTVTALAAGGPVNSNGSEVIYATTSGAGPNGASIPVGGNVWVTTNAMAVSGVSSTFANTTLNGPAGVSINPSQFPISSVAIDTSDATGLTAYVTVMGFTGGPGHVWQTTNAGASWSDFTGTGSNALPDSPVNAVVVDAAAHVVYVGTDVGVFQSATSSPAWSEVGPMPGQTSGFLPDVAVTALAIFNSGGQKLLRASTYGRGVWQYNLLAVPDFQISVSNTPLTVFTGATATFNGTLTALNGYNNTVGLSCIAGTSNPPVPCVASPATLAPTLTGAAFSISSTGTATVADYFFSVQGLGFDPNGTTHSLPLTLHVVNYTMSSPSPSSVTEPRGGTSPPVSFQVSAQGTFNQSVTLSCSFTPNIPGASCAFTPGATFNLTSTMPVNATATVTVPAGTTTGPYGVTIQASTAGATVPATGSFTANVVLNPTFILIEPSSFPNVKAGTTGTTGQVNIASQDGFAATVDLSCITTFGANSCSISPTSVSTFPASATLTINGTSFSAGSYQVEVQGTSGSITNDLPIPFEVGDYTIAGPATLSIAPGAQGAANLSLSSIFSYSGQVNASCNAAALPGAQCSLNPVNPISIGNGAVVPVTAMISVPSNATPGVYDINISTQDVGGEPAHSWAISLTVTQDFIVGGISPSSQTVTPGQAASYNFNVSPVGGAFTNGVMLSCSGLPANSSCSFTPNPVTPGSGAAVTMSIATSSTTTEATSAGTYGVTVTGTSGALSHSSATSLTVNETLQLSVTQGISGTVDANSSQTAKLSLLANYSGSAMASCSVAALSGTICTVSPNPIPVGAAAVSLSALVSIPSSAAPGPYTVSVNVQDANGGPSVSAAIPFMVAADFIVTQPTPSTQTIQAGQSVPYNFSVDPIGGTYNGTVTFGCNGNPNLSLCSFNPASATPGSSSFAVVVTISTTTNAASSLPPVIFYACWGLMPALAWMGMNRRKHRCRTLANLAPLFASILLAFLFVSCGGGGTNGGSGPGGGSQGTPPGTYTITVTGTAGSVSHPSPSFTLVVTQ